MSEENKALVRRWFEEVWNRGRAEAIDEMFAEDGVAHGLADASGEPLRGPASFRPFHRSFREAFPDIEVVVEDVIAEGDKVVARNTVTGTHRGEYLGLPPTGRTIAYSEIFIFRFANGRIAETWGVVDVFSQLRQLNGFPEHVPSG